MPSKVTLGKYPQRRQHHKTNGSPIGECRIRQPFTFFAKTLIHQNAHRHIGHGRQTKRCHHTIQ